MARYGIRLGCRWGQPHDIMVVKDRPDAKFEKCRLCGKRFRWNKGYKGRIDNAEYLKVHVRNFAQRWGATRRVYHKIHSPEKTIIYV